MNDKPVLDPDRDRAIRAMIVETARAEKSRPSLRTRASLLIGLVLAALLVSGGGVAMALTGIIQIPVAAPAPVETPTATPTPTPTPTPTTTPAPPPAPEPTPAAVDLSSWVIGFEGVGPIAYGAPMEDAVAELDTTALVPFDWGFEGCLSDKRDVAENTWAFLMVDPDESGAVDLITVANYVDGDGVQSPASLPRTAAGITPGSTRAELLAAYPEITEEEPVATEAVYSLKDAQGRSLWFRIAGATDTVASITLDTGSQLTLGGCGA
ncbi:hypothetical protein [Rathayibacter sp. VKM Ac-2759]|uniref:hypothetical protein n=1 Tax=Rathayibacter sp. VKM Ac-2759 TaxID=2609252 RepID=UPI001FC9DDE5|nr:hypothetical protein [Rathayibacter sp. VKM Ac-2759]